MVSGPASQVPPSGAIPVPPAAAIPVPTAGLDPPPFAGLGPAPTAALSPPPTAGYSGTPLPTKLGIKPGQAIALIGAPPGFADSLEPLPERVSVRKSLDGDVPFDVIVFFVAERAEMAATLDRLRARMAPACGLWIAWPKRASKVPTDMSDNVVREIALPTGLVDNKVCAIDHVWSGLRLVIRRELR
jgi:hypothetical protein